ncbi:MAG: hypothetical protein H7Z21_13810, partial [Hymenobacter sp.]|nr:hypothetical protein [Hymenobacter sp.]
MVLSGILAMGLAHEAQANGIGAFVNRAASRVVSAVSRKLALTEESRLPAAVASQFAKSPLTATLPEAGYIALTGTGMSYVVSGGKTLIKDVPLTEAYRIGGPLAKQLAK